MRIKYNATSCYNYIMKIWEDTIIKIAGIQPERLAATQHNKKLNNSCFVTNPSSIYSYIHNFYCPHYGNFQFLLHIKIWCEYRVYQATSYSSV